MLLNLFFLVFLKKIGTMEINQILCTNPHIVLNPLWSEYLSRYGKYVIRGKEYFCEDRSILYKKRVPWFLNPHLLKITKDDISTCYFVDVTSGETFDMFMQVPCGHCENCKVTKINAFVHRCKLETMMYSCKPIFLTLTYNEENKPKEGLSVRDCQLFLKRLRVNLFRKGYRERIRYVLVGEYGHNTHRAHYHAILWNLHATDYLDFKAIRDTINESWNQGFCMLRFIDPNNDKGFYYTSKYLRKDNDVPDGCNPTFLLSSNRNGGIGAPFIDTLREFIARSLCTSPKFRNRFNGKVENLLLSKYVLNRIFPSLSRSVGSKVRSAMRDFVFCYRSLQTAERISGDQFITNSQLFDETFIQMSDILCKYVYVYDPKEVRVSCLLPQRQLIRRLLDDERIILSALAKGNDYYSQSLYFANKRDAFLGKLFYSKHGKIDLTNRSNKYLIDRARSIANEIL